MTTVDKIRSWLNKGVEMGATHLVVKTDTFPWPQEDFPVYVMPGKEVLAVAECQEFEKVQEIYSLSLDLDEQLNEHRAYHPGL